MSNPTVVLRLGWGWGFDNKNQEVKNTGKLTPNLRSSMKNKNKNKKDVKPMVANLNKITEYMKPKPDRNISLEDSNLAPAIRAPVRKN